jgi:hypothetical protein
MNNFVSERLWNWLYATEGPVPYMYLDTRSLVTVGIGFMIDPIEKYLSKWGRSFIHADGTPAGPDEVEAEFRRVKALTSLAGAHLNFKLSATLFLPPGAMKPTMLGILREKESALKTEGWMPQYFQHLDSFPPDAQMGCLSTAYGGMFNSSPAQIAYNEACRDRRWGDAAESGRWAGWRPEKIAGHRLMFKNAQVAKDTGDNNPQPAFPGTLTGGGSYEIDDTIRPFKQDIWKAGR